MTSCSSYLFLTKRKTFATYRWRMNSRWQFALNPVVSSSVWLTQTWLVYLQKGTIDIWHISILIPQVALVRLMLHGQRYIHYENVFTSWGRDYKTFLGPHTLSARSWQVARQTRSSYRKIGIVLKQTPSWGDGFGIHITRGRILTFLPFCQCVVIEK
jgi:hypothetical protein